MGSGKARAKHPFYGLGADYVIADDDLIPAAAIERKSLDDLSKRIAIEDPKGQPRIFRQLKDLASHPLPILLLEGPSSALYARVEPMAIGLQFWAARQGISILYSTSPPASANAIFLIARKLAKELEGYRSPMIRDDPDEGPHSLPRSG